MQHAYDNLNTKMSDNIQTEAPNSYSLRQAKENYVKKRFPDLTLTEGQLFFHVQVPNEVIPC